MSSDPLMDFLYKKLRVVPDPDLIASLDPVCDFHSLNDTGYLNQPAARVVFAYIFGIPCALYLLLTFPLMLMRRHKFPVTLKSPVLAGALAIGFACIQIICFWVDIYGVASYPCWLGALTRSLFAPCSVLTFVTELFRIRSKVHFSNALERLAGATNPEEKDKLTKALRREKAHMGWRTDLQSMTICLTPPLIYFFVVVFPEPTIGCVGCVSLTPN